MAGKAGAIFGGGGIPVGAIVQGQFASDPNYLPLDGNDYLASSYPLLDKTNMKSFGSNLPVQRTLPTTQNWTGVAYGASLFVAVNKDGGTYATSPDGTTWTSRSGLLAGGVLGITFLMNLFIAYGYGGALATSPDGITWTSRATGCTYQFSGCVSNGSILVAVQDGTEQGSNQISTSPDGMTWTARSITAAAMRARNIAVFGSEFIILPFSVGGTPAGNFFKSSDGINWYSPYYITQVADVLNQTTLGQPSVHPAVVQGKIYSFTGTTTSYLTENGGVSWKPTATPYVCIVGGFTYVGGMYICPSWNSAHSTILYSPDGKKFSPLNLATSSNWLNPSSAGAPGCLVAYGNNTFVFISSTINIAYCASVAVDTTKFKMPFSSPTGFEGTDSGRYYMKVA